MLLQYEPASGAYVLLSCDGSCDGGAPCSQRLALGRCSERSLPLGPAMRASYVGHDTMLFHNSASGAYTLHRLSCAPAAGRPPRPAPNTSSSPT
eukprot:2285258-Prymnesium_polylepis.1